jgi:hypothetical protein
MSVSCPSRIVCVFMRMCMMVRICMYSAQGSVWRYGTDLVDQVKHAEAEDNDEILADLRACGV